MISPIRLWLLVCFFQTSTFVHATGVLDLPKTIDCEEVSIVRDSFGVPHIFAQTDRMAAYGLAWATAEDDFETMQWALLAAKRMSGLHYGVDGAKIDFASHLLGVAELVDQKYDVDLSPAFRSMLDAYAEAVNLYAQLHPEEVLVKKAFPVSPKELMSGYVLSMCLMSGIDQVLTAIVENKVNEKLSNPGVGSNALAVNSRMTVDGETYLAINSHQPLEGPLSWYEAHIQSEEGWNIVGGLFPGAISVLHGTNEYLGWAHTVNDFDGVDVYQLVMHPEKKNLYRFDQQWLPLHKKEVVLHVKPFKKLPLKIKAKREIYYSVHGAVLKNKEGYFAVRMPANQDIRAAEQWYRMNKAKNFTEFYDILRMQSQSRMTIVYADRYDTIFVLSNGLVPVRNPNYRWDGVLPGDTSATLWDQYHPLENLPQLVQPDCGYVFNVNNSAFKAGCEQDNLILEQHNPSNAYTQKITNRSLRFHEMIAPFEEGRRMTYEDFKRLKYDKQLPADTLLMMAYSIQEIFAWKPEDHPQLREALLIFQKWDRVASLESTEGTLLLQTFYEIYDRAKGQERKMSVDAAFRKEVLEQSILAAMKHMKKYFGTLTPKLGDYQRHVRGSVDEPIDGYPDVWKAMYAKPHTNGRRKVFVGESYIQLIRFGSQGPQIESVNAYGASAKKESPHYTDQMNLYLSEKCKPMSLNRQQVMEQAVRTYHPPKLEK